MALKPHERIPLHAHTDGNDGGQLAAGRAITGLPPAGTVSTVSGGASVLNDLGDVDLVTTIAADQDNLQWNATTGQWEPDGVDVISPTQLAANTDNWSPTGLASAELIRVSTDASRNLTGVVAPTITRIVILANIGAFDLVLKHDATSTAANRFYCPNDADFTLAKDCGVYLVYDLTSTRWRVLTSPAGSGSTSFGTPALTLSTSNAAGAASTAIRTDATILAFDATAPTTQAFGDAAAAGSAGTAARRDHKHAWPALGTTAAAIGTSAGGSATTPSKSDHVHATGAGTPTTQAFGDSAATGSGPAASMTDHKHAMPTAAVTTSGLTQATARILGRTTASTGAIEEITVGSGLSLAAGSLTATGGSGITQSYSGYNTAGGSNEAWGAATTRLTQITLASAGLLASIDFYLDQTANSVGSNIACGVWQDSAGTPGIVIAAPPGSAQILFMGQPPGTYTYTPRWVSAPVGIWLAAGTYWIGGGSAVGTTMRIYYDGSGSDVKWTWSANAQLADGQRFTNTVTSQKFSIRGSILR